MVEPDPWAIIDKNQNNCDSLSDLSPENISETNPIIPSTFEDNFMQAEDSSESLPDSKEYIQSLERKLSKLKTNTNYLDQLKARREHCLANLLEGNITLNDSDNEEALHLDEEFEGNRGRDLLRYIQPEQPINLGELVTIIDYDHLQSDDKQVPFDDKDATPEFSNQPHEN